MDDVNLPEFLTVADVAKRLGVSQPFVRTEVRAGRLHAVRVGRRFFRITPADVEAWLSEVSHEGD